MILNLGRVVSNINEYSTLQGVIKGLRICVV